MAEAALFTIATKILSTVGAPAFKGADETSCSIWNARKELNELKSSIGRIQAVLLDAEKKQKDSAAVKEWIKGVKDVLYDADDLFDEVATDDLLRRPVKGSNKFVKKVLVSCSRLNPLFSNNDIAKRVKNIRKRLLAISNDMRAFIFVECLKENPIGGGVREEQDPGSFVDPKNVVGRDKDKEVILDWLLHDQSDDVQQDAQVIAIVGVGGMGKTTLTQLVYNHEEVQKSFQNRWFSYISDTTNDAEVGRKICYSICRKMLHSTSDVQTNIKESTEGRKFLLVLDDVWNDNCDGWRHWMSLLSSGARGSKIVVSTRSLAVAKAVNAWRTHNLNGLSKEDSWNLFKRVADISEEQAADSRWSDLGRKIVKKCANVPLAINCIAGLLRKRNTIEEWELIGNVELQHLMDLVRSSFFQSILEFDGSTRYKMHDLIHDLARHVAGEECLRLTTSSNKTSTGPRHVSVGYVVDDSWLLPKPLQSDNRRLRSLLFLTNESSGSRLVLGKQFKNLKSLRALSMSYLGIENVPSSIGELKHLRFLDISLNNFKKLPDSITELVNLCTLNISNCRSLEVWPDNFRNLFNLRHLYNHNCVSLKHLPSGFGELAFVQHLGELRVDKGIGGGPRLKLDELHKLNLRGRLAIYFDEDVEDWGVEFCQPPLTLEDLHIEDYGGTRIPHWGKGMSTSPSLPPKLSYLFLYNCPTL